MNSELETLVSLNTANIVLDEASQELNSLLRSGIEAAKNGKRDEAKALLFRVTDIEPENEMAWLWLASVSEYPEELLTFLQKVLNINPENEQALEWERSTKGLLARNLVQYGITAVQENKKESAKRCFKRALETDESNEMAWLWLASIADDQDEKVSYLEKVLEINPGNEVANTLLKLQRKDEAQGLLQKSKASAVRGNKQEALEMLEQIKQLDSELDEVWILQAHLSDSFEEKAFCFNQALNCNPKNDVARVGLASLESILQSVNPDGSTRQLSQAMKDEIEAASQDEGQPEASAQGDILVEDSEEVMESSFLDDSEVREQLAAEEGFVAEQTQESFEEVQETTPAFAEEQFTGEAFSANGPYSESSFEEDEEEADDTEELYFEEKTGEDETEMSEPEQETAQEAFAEYRPEPENSFAGFIVENIPGEAHEEENSFAEETMSNGFEQQAETIEPIEAIEAAESDENVVTTDEPINAHFADLFDDEETHHENGFHSHSFAMREEAEDSQPEQPEMTEQSEMSWVTETAEERSDNFGSDSHQSDSYQPESYQDSQIKAETYYFGGNEKEEEPASSLEASSEEDQMSVSMAAPEQQEFEPAPEASEESEMAEENHEAHSVEFSEPAQETPAETQSFTQGSPCPFCDSENSINDEVCSGCSAVLGLHNMDMLLSRTEADGAKISEAVARMEATLGTNDSVSAEEYYNLGLACLNVKNFDAGLKYLQKSYILNPTNSFLKAQIDELTKRMGNTEHLNGNGLESSVAGKTIMVVDDSATIRKLVSAKLEKHGHKVVMAVDGMDALAKLEEVLPDLILLDITMPRLDGYQVCKLIRANDNTRFIPVVLISGKDGFFDKVRGKMCGSTSYITKPFGPEMLLRTVESYFEQQPAAAV